jgi:hypothetical protein
MPRRRAAATQAVEEIEEIEELEELTELEDPAEEEAPAPKKAAKKTAAPAKKAAPAAKAEASEGDVYDSTWLAEYITEETGVQYDSRSVRMLLRKLAKDGDLDREIGTDRSRYVFPKGERDPIVRQVLKLVKSGADKAIKNEGLNDIKAKKAAEKAETPAKKTTAKAAPAATPAKRTRAAAK